MKPGPCMWSANTLLLAAYSTKTLPSRCYFQGLRNFSTVCSSSSKAPSLEHDLQIYRVKESWGNWGGGSQGPGCLESFWVWKQYLSLVRGGVWCQKKILFKDDRTWEGSIERVKEIIGIQPWINTVRESQIAWMGSSHPESAGSTGGRRQIQT